MQLRIGARIGLGFGVLVVTVLAISTIGVLTLRDASSRAEDARQWSGVLDSAEASTLRVADYLRMRGPSEAAAAEAAIADLVAKIGPVPDAAAAAPAPAADVDTGALTLPELVTPLPGLFAALLESDAQDAARVETVREQVVALRDAAETLETERSPGGQTDAHRVRLRAERLRAEMLGFFAYGDSARLDAAVAELMDLMRLVQQMQSADGDKPLIDQINWAIFNIFESAEALRESASAVLEKQTALGTRLSAVRDRIVDRSRAAAAATIEGAAASTDVMTTVAAVALILALVLSALTARSITRPLARIRDAMGRLAEGDLTVALTDEGRRDEIGEMSAAVAVFRENAVRVVGMAEREETMRAQAVADRQKTMGELHAAFSDVVAAAAAGDFSRRVDARFGDEALDELAEGLNRIVQEVDAFVADLDAGLIALAAGDLTRRPNVDRPGAFGAVARNAGRTIDGLGGLVQAIREAGGAIDGAARVVARDAEDLAERGETQSATLTQTSAVTRQLAAAARQTATNASRADEIVSEARSRAEQGGAVVGDAVAAMDRLVTGSKRIAEIIEIIDDVAFQTNLLALNAAVEAARAGEAGKSFSVVAQEVRSLANRVSVAAKDVSETIVENEREVREGVRLVEATGGALGEIVTASNDAAAAVAEISRAAQEQTTGVDELAAAVDSLEDLTRANVELSERGAGTARGLTGHVDGLNDAVSVFRLDESGDAPKVAARAA